MSPEITIAIATAAVPTVTVLLGILLNKSDINTLRGDLNRLSGKIDSVHIELSGRIDRVQLEVSDRMDRIQSELSSKIDRVQSELSSRIDRISADLIRFYEILGEHTGKIDSLRRRD